PPLTPCSINLGARRGGATISFFPNELANTALGIRLGCPRARSTVVTQRPRARLLSEPDSECGVDATRRQSIVLRVAELAFSNRRAFVAEVVTVHADFPARRAIACAGVERCVPGGQRRIALIQEPGADVRQLG